MAKLSAKEIAEKVRAVADAEREARAVKRAAKKEFIVMGTATGRVTAGKVFPFVEELRAKAAKVPGNQGNNMGKFAGNKLARSW